MKNLLSTLLFIIASLSLSLEQKDQSLTASALGLTVGQPAYVEYEALLTSKISLALRAGYRNRRNVYTAERHYSSTNYSVIDYNHTRVGGTVSGVFRVYPKGTGNLRGPYLGLAAGVSFGDDDNIVSAWTEYGDWEAYNRGTISQANEYDNGVAFFHAMFQVGYKILIGPVVIDPALAVVFEGMPDPYRYRNAKVLETYSNFHLHPSLAIGFRF